MNEQDFKTVEAMQTYGGSFVKALAECFHRADPHNFTMLKLAFLNYWTQYEMMTKEPKMNK